MDDFSADRQELDGTLMSLEFGPGGRIQQIWASDPHQPDEHEEFQFVLGPMTMGEEFSEDYLPGTILIGARTNPDDPWIVSRASDAEPTEFNEEDPSQVAYEYDFPFLPEIRATGRYYETLNPIPQIVWELRIANRGKISIEIGELAFPFALHNLSEGHDALKGGDSILHDRVHVHSFVGGNASYLHALRMNGDSPGLLIYPGDDTRWELVTHAPASLHSPYKWEGIPVVYVYSRATVEREGWGGWFNEHTALILEPGDSRIFQTRFAVTGSQGAEGLHSALAACNKPAIRVLPSAIAPKDVGIALEITGTTPTQFFLNKDATTETDADENGGFCFIKPHEAGSVRVSFEDAQSRLSHAHLLFIEPIEELICKRAEWVAANQVQNNPESVLHHAILPTNIRTGERIDDVDSYGDPFTMLSGLADTAFLAEKNVSYPLQSEIDVLDDVIQDFIKDDIQNPSDGSVGSAFADFMSVAVNYGVAPLYPLVFSTYLSMYRIAKTTSMARHEPKAYLIDAAMTAKAMFRWSDPETGGIMGYSFLEELLLALEDEGLSTDHDEIVSLAEERSEDVYQRGLSGIMRAGWDSAGFEEIYEVALKKRDKKLQERTLRCAFAARSLAPSWWWYASDPRIWEIASGSGNGNSSESASLMLGYTSPANSMMFFKSLGNDYGSLPEAYLRLAFGGMLAPWALVRPDGAGSMGFCPDPATKMRGPSPVTGDLGIALLHYLKGAASYVLPSRNYGVFTFGCHFEPDSGGYKVHPWDGIGRRIVMRQIGCDFEISFGKIEELQLDSRKRWVRLKINNPADQGVPVKLKASGLWGRQFLVTIDGSPGKVENSENGTLSVDWTLPKDGVQVLEIKVIG